MALWYAMTSHVIAYCSKELLFGMHAFNFNCFLHGFYLCIYADALLICTAEYGSNIFLLLIEMVLLSTHDICSE